MGLGGCYSCIKYLMFAFNFLFWLLGCAILGVGIWVRMDPNFRTYAEGHENFEHLYTGAYILIGVGVVIMVIGFLGCCGAIRESQCMLASFFICLFIIFIALLGAGIWAILKKNDLRSSVTKTLDDCVDNYQSDAGCQELVDNVQEHFDCCGASHGVSDYGLTPNKCNALHFLTPCDDKLFEFFRNNLVIIAGTAIGIGVVMLFGMFFSMYLCCKIRRAHRIDKYRYQ